MSEPYPLPRHSVTPDQPGGDPCEGCEECLHPEQLTLLRRKEALHAQLVRDQRALQEAQRRFTYTQDALRRDSFDWRRRCPHPTTLTKEQFQNTAQKWWSCDLCDSEFPTELILTSTRTFPSTHVGGRAGAGSFFNAPLPGPPEPTSGGTQQEGRVHTREDGPIHLTFERRPSRGRGRARRERGISEEEASLGGGPDPSDGAGKLRRGSP